MRPGTIRRVAGAVAAPGLAGGRWGGRPVVSEDWIREATCERTTIDRGRRLRLVYASGHGGQRLFIVPAPDLVVVLTGGSHHSPRAGRPFELLVHALLPAVPSP